MASPLRRSRGEILGAYKRLIREVDTQLTVVTQNLAFRNFIRDEFRKEKDPMGINEGYLSAIAYLHLLTSSKHFDHLRDYYAIAPPSVDQRKKIEQNAATVGVKLPQWTIDTSAPVAGDTYKTVVDQMVSKNKEQELK